MKRYVFSLFTSLVALSAQAGELPVTGTGTVNAEPDRVTITAVIDTDHVEAAKAMSKNLMLTDQVMEALGKSDLKVDVAKNVRTTGLSMYTYYERDTQGAWTNKVAGNKVTQKLSVCYDNPKKAGALLDVLTKNGATGISQVQFHIKNQEQLVDEARKLAVKDAQRKAALLAEASGVNLVTIKNVSEADVYNRGYATASMDAGARGLATGQLSIQVNVQLTYEISDKKQQVLNELKKEGEKPLFAPRIAPGQRH